MSLEAVIFVPLMIAVLAATFSFHDAFRYKALNTKAAYTISDALSRETDPINNAYIDGMVSTMEYLTRSEGPYSLRVTMVRWNKKKQKYRIDWSKTRGGFEPLKNGELNNNLSDQLPNLLHNERVIVVETQTQYEPPFEVPGLQTAELFYNFAFSRPRFAPKLVWSDN
ncbi:TadE/TadG family type IV pilus assembly protein [Thalassococcus lentus]|uniref:Pilus assembly protein n=1 Tax=Thalassococcus lentus TaxID=1210524 RepID=A0ABT4XWA7_9RHOB|nr:hypothetical protein [Thalassococcus lentus]MDA7426088.1 hypothetical protein [Thalassococcus lentus]